MDYLHMKLSNKVIVKINSGNWQEAFDNASEWASDWISDTDKLFRLNCSFHPRDKASKDGEGYIHLKDGAKFKAKILFLPEFNKRITTKNIYDFIELTDANNATIFAYNEVDNYISQLKVNMGTDITIVKEDALDKYGSLTERDEVMERFIKATYGVGSECFDFAPCFRNGLITLGFDEAKNPFIAFVRNFAKDFKMRSEYYNEIYYSYKSGEIDKKDLLGDSILYNQSLYNFEKADFSYILSSYRYLARPEKIKGRIRGAKKKSINEEESIAFRNSIIFDSCGDKLDVTTAKIRNADDVVKLINEKLNPEHQEYSGSWGSNNNDNRHCNYDDKELKRIEENRIYEEVKEEERRKRERKEAERKEWLANIENENARKSQCRTCKNKLGCRFHENPPGVPCPGFGKNW